MKTLHVLLVSLVWMCAVLPESAIADASPDVWNTEIASVSVNGGSDTHNGGFTCVRIKADVLPACTGGYVAILNSNKLLVTAALQAKASNSKIWFYYAYRSQDNHHCPGKVFTPCSVISIEVQ